MSDFFEPDSKKRKLLDDLALTNTEGSLLGVEADLPDDHEDTAEPMSYEELIDTSYKSCYACRHMNTEALQENKDYLYMMKLYTQNASSICKDGIYDLIKDHFEKHVKPYTGVTNTETGEIEYADWTIDCIREHFKCHTAFPTDEVINEIAIKKALRNKLVGNLVSKKKDGTLIFNNNNIKTLIALDKEIMALYKSKKDIPNMIGYNEVLNY
jgi:hypothetical protein